MAQVFRIRRPRQGVKYGTHSEEVVYGITSVPPERGAPEQLLEWNRGHWAVENLNHRHRDVHFSEDACLARTGHGPGNHALCNNLALAVIFNRGSRSAAHQMKHFVLHRKEALDAILT